MSKRSHIKIVENGIKEVFDDLFPAESFSGTFSLDFVIIVLKRLDIL